MKISVTVLMCVEHGGGGLMMWAVCINVFGARRWRVDDVGLDVWSLMQNSGFIVRGSKTLHRSILEASG